MTETYPAYAGLVTIVMMAILFVGVPWFAHKVISRPRPTLLPPSAPSCAALVMGVAGLWYLTQRSTDPRLTETWGSLALLFAGILLFIVVVSSSWLKPLRKQSNQWGKPAIIVGRVTFILLSFAVFARSVQLHPVGLGPSPWVVWNTLELVTWLFGWMGAISLVGLLVVMGVTHRRDQKAAAVTTEG